MLAPRRSLAPSAGGYPCPWWPCTGHSWDSLLASLPVTLCNWLPASPRQGRDRSQPGFGQGLLPEERRATLSVEESSGAPSPKT